MTPTIEEIKTCAQNEAIREGYQPIGTLRVQPIKRPRDFSIALWHVTMQAYITSENRNANILIEVKATSGAIYAETVVNILNYLS